MHNLFIGIALKNHRINILRRQPVINFTNILSWFHLFRHSSRLFGQDSRRFRHSSRLFGQGFRLFRQNCRTAGQCTRLFGQNSRRVVFLLLPFFIRGSLFHAFPPHRRHVFKRKNLIGIKRQIFAHLHQPRINFHAGILISIIFDPGIDFFIADDGYHILAEPQIRRMRCFVQNQTG